ncbi:MAG TPA: hypothetical protein VK046_10010 [Actinomycetaceae bacterium]|nr:hypothetical protein [Actinomycetaceae bacterium]
MKRMKSSEVRENWRALLDDVEKGETIIIEHYNRPVARLVPYIDRTLYTIAIQGTDDGKGWQTMSPTPETVTESEAADMGYVDAADVARDTAYNQTIAEGEGWRVRVWEGEDPDTGAEPAGECYWHEITQ